MKVRQRAFTLVALLVVLTLLALLVALMLSAQVAARRKAQKIRCADNLKQCITAFKVWPGDQSDDFPMGKSEKDGGSLECVTSPETFRHFQVASNELSSPKVLVCPADPDRTVAANFSQFSNRNVSYFVDLDAVDDADPQQFLFGDRNIVSEHPPQNGVLKIFPGQTIKWTSSIHVSMGNISMADGSVRSVTSISFPQYPDNAVPTNGWRLSLPE